MSIKKVLSDLHRTSGVSWTCRTIHCAYLQDCESNLLNSQDVKDDC